MGSAVRHIFGQMECFFPMKPTLGLRLKGMPIGFRKSNTCLSGDRGTPFTGSSRTGGGRRPTQPMKISITGTDEGCTGNVGTRGCVYGVENPPGAHIVCAMHVARNIEKKRKGINVQKQDGNGKIINESQKSCIRCSQPASIERATMALNQYRQIDDGDVWEQMYGTVETVVYLCRTCAGRELGVVK